MVKKMLSGKNAEGVLLAVGALIGFLFGSWVSGAFAWLFVIALVLYLGWSWYNNR